MSRKKTLRLEVFGGMLYCDRPEVFAAEFDVAGLPQGLGRLTRISPLQREVRQAGRKSGETFAPADPDVELDGPEADPTPEEIAAECEAIRQGWTGDVEDRRWNGRPLVTEGGA